MGVLRFLSEEFVCFYAFQLWLFMNVSDTLLASGAQLHFFLEWLILCWVALSKVEIVEDRTDFKASFFLWLLTTEQNVFLIKLHRLQPPFVYPCLLWVLHLFLEACADCWLCLNFLFVLALHRLFLSSSLLELNLLFLWDLSFVYLLLNGKGLFFLFNRFLFLFLSCIALKYDLC